LSYTFFIFCICTSVEGFEATTAVYVFVGGSETVLRGGVVVFSKSKNEKAMDEKVLGLKSEGEEGID
jgi:hypothetical protein